MELLHILGHKAISTKTKKIKIIPCSLTVHNGMKLEIRGKEKHKKHSKSWSLNNTLLNNQIIIEEIRKGIKTFLD
jgi:hypothetical protein